jgi:S-layer protein (TIGR01567 family)
MKFSSIIIAIVILSLFTGIAFAAPAPPTGLHAEDFPDDNGGKILITWTKSDNDGSGGNNVTNYDILRAISSDGTYAIIGNTSNGKELYIDDNTTDGIEYFYKVNATDGFNSSSSDPEGPVKSYDNIPPVIYSVTNGTVTDSTAIITWTTDENSTSRVEYDKVSSSYSFYLENSSLVTSHSLILTGLNASTTYYYRVMSTDGAGNTNISDGNSFITATDSSNPTVIDTYPENSDSDIPLDANVTAKFSEKMNASTINVNSFTLSSPSGPISGTVTYNDPIATLNPNSSLDYGTIYTATITSTVEDIAGNRLALKNWSFTTVGNKAPVASNNSVTPTEGITPVTFTFYVTFTDAENNSLTSVYLYIDGDSYPMTQVDANDHITDDGKDYIYNTTISDLGTYKYYFKAITDFNTGTSDTKEFKVNTKTYYSGNRIWDTSMSRKYTWDPQSFSGFYYDLDNDEGNETLTITDIDRSLDEGDIEYKTSPMTIDFEQDIWKTYEVIGFMADRYFAGYTDDTTFASASDSLLDERQLSKVLLDTDNKYNIRSGTPLELEEDYDFRIAEFGSEGGAVMVALFKNGEKVDEDIVEKGDTYVYEKDMGGARDMPIIAIYFDTVFVGTETSTVVIEGIFQVSDKYIDVSTGDQFGLMEIKSVSSSGITMKNDDSVSLGEGDDFNLMGKINIVVADHGTLRFAPYVDMSEPGTYELRGTVTEENTFKWTPFNFEGLLYNIDTGEGDETLNIERSGRSVDNGDLTYTTNPISKKFEHSGDGWNTFQSIGFMGDTYFAGYLKESSFISSDRSLINEGKLSKILIDEDKKHTLNLGNSLTLEEGYSLRIDEISRSGDALMLTLLKNGEEITTDIVSDGDTYLYEVDVDGTDIPIILAYIDKVFSGMETNSIFIDGLFQISDSFTTVEKGDTYGIMEVRSFSSSSIVLKNEDSFSLDRGDTIKIMGDIKFKVADDGSAVRFYPFQEIIVKEPLYLDLDIPDSIYENEEFTISVTSDGDEVEDVSIIFGDSEIGTTDSNGELIYTPIETGEFKVTASKSGYESDSEKIEILYQPKLLEIKAPLLADRGETIFISVTSEGKSVSGVSVMLGSNDLGTTPESGNITYIPDQIGTHTITASKSGYQDASKDIDITDPSVRLVYSNLTIEPKRVQPGENVNITVEAANFGTLRDADTMTIMVDGKEIATEDLVLGPGEIMTLEFTLNRSKPGKYLVEVDGRSDTFNVIGSQMSPIAIIILVILAILTATAVIYSYAQGTLSSEIIIGKARAFEKSLRRLIEK